MLDAWARSAVQPLPDHHDPSRQREQKNHQKEQESGSERLIGTYPETAEEADEERLPDSNPVQRERDEHDEKEERAHDVIDPRAEIDTHRTSRGPDREDAHGLHGE